MTLSDRMVYAGIVNSRRMAQLSWFQRDFFRNLIHAADGHGRFEADAVMLRAVLYGLLSHKVTVRDVQEAMTRCHAIGLVKLYTVDGRGYGKVINYRQTLAKRRALYPDEDGAPPDPDLFSAPTEGKKEGNDPQPPAAAGGRNASLSLSEPPRHRRMKRLPKLDTLHDERQRIEREIEDIIRPAGRAFAQEPTDLAKISKLELLRLGLRDIMSTIETTRAALAERTGETAA
jgi:hypothetical protein